MPFVLAASTTYHNRYVPLLITSALYPPKSGEASFSGTILPPELLDHIMDFLYDDRPSLLALGLTSKQTLLRSCLHLFIHMEFTGDKDFDAFLTLLEALWTSFAYNIESIHIVGLSRFPPSGDKYGVSRVIPVIASHLPNLKTL